MVALYQIDTVRKRFYVIFIFTILYHFGTHILYSHLYPKKVCGFRAGESRGQGEENEGGAYGPTE